MKKNIKNSIIKILIVVIVIFSANHLIYFFKNYSTPEMVKEITQVISKRDNRKDKKNEIFICSVDKRYKDDLSYRRNIKNLKIVKSLSLDSNEKNQRISSIIERYITLENNINSELDKLKNMGFSIKKIDRLFYFDCSERDIDSQYIAYYPLYNGLISSAAISITLNVKDNKLKKIKGSIKSNSL